MHLFLTLKTFVFLKGRSVVSFAGSHVSKTVIRTGQFHVLQTLSEPKTCSLPHLL